MRLSYAPAAPGLPSSEEAAPLFSARFRVWRFYGEVGLGNNLVFFNGCFWCSSSFVLAIVFQLMAYFFEVVSNVWSGFRVFCKGGVMLEPVLAHKCSAGLENSKWM